MAKVFGLLVVSGLAVSSSVLVGLDPVRASSLTYPEGRNRFPGCTATDQEFCVELLEVTLDAGGGTTVIEPSKRDRQYGFQDTGPMVSVFMSQPYTGPDTQPSDVATSLNINYANDTGFTKDISETGDGLLPGVYRVRVRVGDFDPSQMFLNGDFVAYTIERGVDGYFTIDVSARPTPNAAVVVWNDDSTALQNCRDSNWAHSCEANRSYRHYLLTSFSTNRDPTRRAVLRGSWTATTGSEFSTPYFNITTGSLAAKLAGPHFLPLDFGDLSGTIKETYGGVERQVNPAFYKTYITYSSIAHTLSGWTRLNITADQVKEFMSQPSSVLVGYIRGLTGSEVPQNLSYTIQANGVLVDFNVKHFSRVDPRVQVVNPVQTPSQQTNVTTTPSPQAESLRKPSKLRNGAEMSTLKRAAPKKSYKSKALFAPAAGTSVKKIVSRSKSVCTTSGTKVKMLRAGQCRLAVTAVKKGKSSSTTVTITVA